MIYRISQFGNDILSAIREIREDIHAIAEGRKASSANESDQPVDPQWIKVFGSPDATPAIREYYRAENRQRNGFWGTHKSKFEATAIVVAIVIAIFNLLTLREIQQQTPAVVKSAEAAVEAAKIAGSSLEISNRAYLTATKPQVAATGREITIPVHNYGYATKICGRLDYVTFTGSNVATRKQITRTFKDQSAIIQPGGSSHYAVVVDIPAFQKGQKL